MISQTPYRDDRKGKCMEGVTYQINDDQLVIYLSGRVDASNASLIEEKITDALTAAPGNEAVIDAEQLEYISSAGLRIFLRLRKKKIELTLLNVCPEVYDILEMTGFTEMMTVQKGYRHLSVEGCNVIGRGANGIIYRYDAETIVKVYFQADALPDIQRERELARKALVMGINTAIPYDVVRVGKGYGTVMELLEAASLSKMIQEDPEHLDKAVEIFVGLLRQIHETQVEAEGLPDMKQVAMKWVDFDRNYLSEEISSKLCMLVETVPECNKMLHGDYHPNNVMMRDGEAILIDMDTLCMGHPVFELGSIFNALVGFGELDHEEIMRFLGVPFEVTSVFWHKVLMAYLGTEDPERITEVENKAKVIGYARLLRRAIRRDEPDRERMTEHCKVQLGRLVPRIDTLSF